MAKKKAKTESGSKTASIAATAEEIQAQLDASNAPSEDNATSIKERDPTQNEREMSKQIKSSDKIRDLRICLAYIDGKTPEEIVPVRSLSIGVRQVQIILSKNAEFVDGRVAWSKTKRIHKLQRWIGSNESKKDPADLLEQVRKEVEGDKVNIEVKILTPEERKMRVDRLAEYYSNRSKG